MGPQVNTYIRRLEDDMKARGFAGSLFMMGSNGGLLSVERTCRQPVSLVESGPIGGCIGAGAYAEELGFKNVVAFDMGGTTAKCALVEDGRFNAMDPITLEVLRYGLISTANQIDANIKRTAFSPYICEYNDFAVGVTDIKGRLVAQRTGGMPPFVADSVGTAVRDGIKTYGMERLHFGDVLVCNHAAVRGQHLNNTVMYTPIAENIDGSGALVGFFAINVHWIDIGGTMNNSREPSRVGRSRRRRLRPARRARPGVRPARPRRRLHHRREGARGLQRDGRRQGPRGARDVAGAFVNLVPGFFANPFATA